MSHFVGNIWAAVVSFDAGVNLKEIVLTRSLFSWIDIVFLVLNLRSWKKNLEKYIHIAIDLRDIIYLEALPLCRAVVFIGVDAKDERRRGRH